MPLLGKAAVAMWWTIRPELRDEFGDWHSHEHFPERMSIPGFLRGSRWSSSDGGGGFFVLYELKTYETLTSPAYVQRLNDPTPWSTKMMPHHLSMMRSQSRVLASHGGGVAGSMTTVRLSPRSGSADALLERLDEVLTGLSVRPGLTGAHLLQTETPKLDGLTTEQKIRGGDTTADWIILLAGYDTAAVQAIAGTELSPDRMQEYGADATVRVDTFGLAFAFTPGDL